MYVCVCLNTLQVMPELFSDRFPFQIYYTYSQLYYTYSNTLQVMPELFSDRFAFQDPDVKLKGIENYARESLVSLLHILLVSLLHIILVSLLHILRC